MAEAWREVAKMEQQMFTEIFGVIDWDVFLPRERKILDDKVGMFIYGPPDVEFNASQRLIIKKVTDAIVQNNRHCNSGGASATWVSVVMVVVQPQKGAYYCHPVFRVPQGEGHAFVDCMGRFYRTWQGFLKENKLPEDSDICYPPDGVYSQTTSGNVELEFGRTKSRTLLKVADGSSDVLAVGSLAVAGMAALSLPVAAPVVAGAAVVSAFCGVYDAARAIGDQVDRAKHGQKIGLGSFQSASNWFTIGVGLFGVRSAYKVCKVVQAKGALTKTTKLGIAGRSGGSLRNPGGGTPQRMYRDARLKAVPLRHLSWYALMFGHVVADTMYVVDFLVSPRGAEGITSLSSQCVVMVNRRDILRSLEYLGLQGEGRLGDLLELGVSSLSRHIPLSQDVDVQSLDGVVECLKRTLGEAAQLYANFTVDGSAALYYFSKYNLTRFFELSVKISMQCLEFRRGAALGVLYMLYRYLQRVVEMAKTEVPCLMNVSRDSILDAARLVLVGSGEVRERFCLLCTEYLLPTLGEDEGPVSSNFTPARAAVLGAAGQLVGRALDEPWAEVAFFEDMIFVIVRDPNIPVKVVRVERGENGSDLVASVVR